MSLAPFKSQSFCRALGRTDLFDKYSQTLAVHNGGVSEAPAAAPKRRETTIKALPDETVAKIKAHANELYETFMTETSNIPTTFFDAYDESQCRRGRTGVSRLWC